MFPVQWTRSALGDLAEVWMRSDSAGRSRVTAAVEEIDALLGADPSGEGESRDHGRRFLLVPPLALLYRIDAEEVVRVLNVWEYPVRTR